MGYLPSDTAKRIVALLSNAKELAVHRQLRTSAIGVVKACKEIAEQRKFGTPSEMFDVLLDGIKEKNSQALLELFSSIEEAVVKIDVDRDIQDKKRHRPEVKDYQDPNRAQFLYLG